MGLHDFAWLNALESKFFLFNLINSQVQHLQMKILSGTIDLGKVKIGTGIQGKKNSSGDLPMQAV